MSYSVVEFANDEGVSVVCSKWLTPRKREVYWPPVKDDRLYRKLLQSESEYEEIQTWTIYGVTRVFYETNDLVKAEEKVKLAQITSDLQSESSDVELKKRKRVPKKNYSDDDCDEDTECIVRPPPVRRKLLRDENISTLKSSPSSSRLIQDCSQSYFHESPKIARNIPAENVEQIPTFRPSPSTSRVFQDCSQFYPQESSNSTRRIPDDQQIYLKLLLQIKEQNTQLIAQNKEILKVLNKKCNDAPGVLSNLDDLGLNLPAKTDLDLQNLEEFLNTQENFQILVQYFSKIGGKDITSSTNRILKELFDDSLAKNYNYCGQRTEKSNKKSFRKHIVLHNLIIAAVRQGHPAATEDLVEKSIKIYLKHAPERFKKKSNA